MQHEVQPYYYNSNPQPYYYTQAAGQDENPFLTDAGAQDPLAGEKSRNGQSRNSCPPARPPPPRMNETVDSSPARGPSMVQKSAFDDLNDTIKSALVNASPSKSIPFDSGAVGQKDMHQPVAGLFSSSSQQHAFAQPQMFTSTPVLGHTNNSNLSSSSFGGGSQ